MIKEFARAATAAGFRVWIGETGQYGIYSDARAVRVVHFYASTAGIAFAGVYRSANGGLDTWRMLPPACIDRRALHGLLYARPPAYIVGHPVYANLYEKLTFSYGEFESYEQYYKIKEPSRRGAGKSTRKRRRTA